MNLRCIRICLLILFCWISPAFGSSGYSVIKSIFLPPEFYVGDTVELRLLLRLEEDIEAHKAEIVKKKQWLVTENVIVQKLDNKKYQVRIFFIPFRPGVMTLPPIRLGNILLDNIKINTNSVLKEASRIKGLREQLVLPWTAGKILAVILMILGFPILFLFAVIRTVRIVKRIRKNRLYKLPYIRAVKSLNKLKKGIDKADPRSFFISLSLMLKKFLADRLHAPVLSATTGEIAVYLKSYHGEQITEAILNVLHQADLVKFAGRQTGREKMIETYKCVLDLIDGVEENVES